MGMKLLKNHFFTGVNFDSSEELMKFASKILLDEGYVKEEYEESLITREKTYPTGIQAYINFAMPHAELENVNKSTFMVFVLDKPVKFNNMIAPEETLNVDVVILLVLKGKSEHLEFLTKITSIFAQGEEVKEIIAKKPDEQYEYFDNKFSVVEE